jgi:VanZ family protein
MASTNERFWRILFAIWIAVVTVLSILPPSAMPPTFGISDLIQHAAAYAAGSFCAVMGWRRGRAILLAVTGAIALGAMLELVQETLIPGRTGEWHDVAANAAGGIAGAAAALLWHRHRRRDRFTDP